MHRWYTSSITEMLHTVHTVRILPVGKRRDPYLAFISASLLLQLRSWRTSIIASFFARQTYTFLLLLRLTFTPEPLQHLAQCRGGTPGDCSFCDYSSLASFAPAYLASENRAMSGLQPRFRAVPVGSQQERDVRSFRGSGEALPVRRGKNKRGKLGDCVPTFGLYEVWRETRAWYPVKYGAPSPGIQ